MTDEEIDALERALGKQLKRWRMSELYPDTGPLRRELYGKHLSFFRASVQHREILFMAANRPGKTISGAYATTVHLTGRYPTWWPGRRFEEAGEWTAAGTTTETTRDIVQAELFGPGEAYGTGMIPAADIDDIKRRPNTNGAIDYAMIKRQGGGLSRLTLKSYEQGRKAFEGTARAGIWLDEEPPQAIYTECLTRTATTNGIVMITFTPLGGATDVVMDFIEHAEVVE